MLRHSACAQFIEIRIRRVYGRNLRNLCGWGSFSDRESLGTRLIQQYSGTPLKRTPLGLKALSVIKL